MEWIKISNPPSDMRDTLLWHRCMRHDLMLRAFYDYYNGEGKCWMNEGGEKIPEERLKEYTHWLKIQPPTAKDFE